MQTTFTRIFIALESVSHGLHENWDEICRKVRKFKGFFRPKSDGLQKKKKRSSSILRLNFRSKSEIQRFFLPKIRWSPKKKKKKKKGLHRFWGWFFGPTRKSKRLRGGCFPMGGYFQFFTKNRLQHHQKGAILHTSKPMGGLEPPHPAPLATLLISINYRWLQFPKIFRSQLR